MEDRVRISRRVLAHKSRISLRYTKPIHICFEQALKLGRIETFINIFNGYIRVYTYMYGEHGGRNDCEFPHK